MSHQVLPFILAGIPAFLWVSWVRWLFARRLGQPEPFYLFKRSRPKLRMDIGQHIAFGVLGFGVPLAMFHLIDRWLRWKLYGAGSFDVFDGWVDAIGIGLLAGMLFGFSSASTDPD